MDRVLDHAHAPQVVFEVHRSQQWIKPFADVAVLFRESSSQLRFATVGITDHTEQGENRVALGDRAVRSDKACQLVPIFGHPPHAEQRIYLPPEAPAEAYNPLFIYGGVGLGKTHLMHAIGHHIREQFPETKLLYISSENFTNELISAIQQNKNAEFRARFRNVDVLMVDDIQFIAGRDSTQEEFFHTFNTLHTAGKQIVISSDKPPKEIMRLEERLVSRFEWGLIADIQKPDFETRFAILRKKAASEAIQVGDEVLTFIASHIDSNIRELEGSLTRVVAYATLTGRPVTPELAAEALKDVLSLKDTRRITCDLIQQTVAEYYSITMAEMKAKRRSREISIPRQIAMYLTRELTEMSLTQIGAAFNRDHTTVIHACEKVSEDARSDAATANLLEDLRRAVRSR